MATGMAATGMAARLIPTVIILTVTATVIIPTAIGIAVTTFTSGRVTATADATADINNSDELAEISVSSFVFASSTCQPRPVSTISVAGSLLQPEAMSMKPPANSPALEIPFSNVRAVAVA
jgi:hypothetical protein